MNTTSAATTLAPVEKTLKSQCLFERQGPSIKKSCQSKYNKEFVNNLAKLSRLS